MERRWGSGNVSYSLRAAATQGQRQALEAVRQYGRQRGVTVRIKEFPRGVSKNFTKLATVDRRENELYVRAYSRTHDGLWIASEPVVKIRSDAEKMDIAHAIRCALENSKTGVDMPENWSALVKPLLKAAGLRSAASFFRNAVSCHVEQNEGCIKLTPTENDGKGYFEALVEHEIVITADCHADALADAVIKALDLCRIKERRTRR